MKLLLVILAVVSVNAQTSADTRVCCFAPGATACTIGIPAGLCTAAGGRFDEVDTTGSCCCFAGDAGDGDRCLPDVPRIVCLGASVQGRCQAQNVERCCCRPKGVVNDLQCIPRVPVALCDKTEGAACVVAPTPVPVCLCTIPGQAPRELPEEVCDKFGGQCATTPTGPSTCCCIFDGQLDLFGQPIFPDPTDPNVPARGECLPNTDVRICTRDAKKRSGVCHTGPATGAAADPRCQCQDPAVTGFVAPILGDDGLPASLLRSVCEEKLASNCIVPTCCCKYPSAANEPCLPNIQVPVCTAVAGARCVNRLALATLQANQLEEFGDSTCFGGDARQLVRATGTGTDSIVGSTFNPVTNLLNLGTPLPLFNLDIFLQQPSGQERVYTRFLGGAVQFELSPASENFVLGAVNLKGSPLQLPSQAEYTIDIIPTTVTPTILSGFIDGNNQRAIITPLATAGQFRISWTNTVDRVHGLLQFDGAVSTVKFTFASPVAGAAVDTATSSGVFATFKGPYSLPAVRAIVIETIQGPLGVTPNEVLTTIDARGTAACTAAFNDAANFPTLPMPQVFDAGFIIGDVRFNFGSAVATDSLLIHFANMEGATVVIVQSDAVSALPAVVSGLAAATNVDRTFTIGAAGNGVIQVFGSPAQIIINFDGAQGPAAAVGFSFGGLPTGAAAVASPQNDAYATSF